MIAHFVNKADEASKALEEQQELMKEGRKAYAEASMEIQDYTARLSDSNLTKEQESHLVEELNSKYGESLGYYDSTSKRQRMIFASSTAAIPSFSAFPMASRLPLLLRTVKKRTAPAGLLMRPM